MRHNIPKISEVNLELIDVHFYYDQEVKVENIGVSISTKASFNKNNSLVFFIHIRYILENNESEKLSLFHTDYISAISIDEVDWSKSESIEIEKSYLAHLLGMSFLIVRGAISNRLSANFLSQVQLPIINPLELLNNSLKSTDENFILSNELSGHGKEAST